MKPKPLVTLFLLGTAAFAASPSASGQSSQSPESSQKPSLLTDLFVQDYVLNEDKPVGANGEPSWVQNRRFSTTRIYIQQDPWEVGLEQWYRVRDFDDGRVTQRSQTEIEIGLPYRMQLDIYENIIHDNSDHRGWEQEEVAVELRYAFADWGKLPLNPTLYFEYAFCHEGSDGIEPKILIGDDFGNGWHYGVNFIHERRVWGDAEAEWGIAAGISKTIVDSCWSIGIEGKWTHPEGDHNEGILGPSVQWLPTENTHLDLVAMGGLTDSSPNVEAWLIFGFDFGSGKHEQHGYKPSSLGN